MKWSWRIARIAGIDLYVHVTFLILVGWVALSHYLARQSPADAFTWVAFIFSLFAIVVLHELGHALTARRFGIPTPEAGAAGSPCGSGGERGAGGHPVCRTRAGRGARSLRRGGPGRRQVPGPVVLGQRESRGVQPASAFPMDGGRVL